MSKLTDNFKKLDYEYDPVFYCKKCLSLNIRQIPGIDGTEYCDDCGSTNITWCLCSDWERQYIRKYGEPFLKIHKH